MRIAFRSLWVVFPALGIAATVMMGCSEGTTRKDVASAQQKLDKAQQSTADAVNESHRDIANAQQQASEHTVAKPVTPDQPVIAPPSNPAAQQGVADAHHEATDKIADAKDKERAAAADLKSTEQKFQATQERDAFVKDAEAKLADYDTRIDGLKKQASTADGANKDTINRQIDTVKNQRSLANKALSELKGADLATWKNHQDHVRMAFQELDNSMKNVR